MAIITLHKRGYMEKIKVLVSWSGDNYAVGTGQIGGAVFATGKTIDEAKSEFESAFQFHLDGCLADGDDLPEFVKNNDYEFDYEMQISAILHYFDGILTRAALARVTGINQRQLGHYASGLSTPRPAQRKKIINGFHRIASELNSVV
jgi:predicted RNase H-like HicB family nuclease